MTLLTLSALPEHYEQTDGRRFRVTVIEILGENLGHARVEARSVAETARAVKLFGDDIAARRPDRSFSVAVIPLKGSRKFAGFDAADRSDQFGQTAWMKTIREPAGRPGPGAA